MNSGVHTGTGTPQIGRHLMIHVIRSTVALALVATLLSPLSFSQVAEAELTAGDATFAALLGQSVGLDGDLAVVGAPGLNNSAGAVYLYRLVGTTWSQEAKLVASDASAAAQFGFSVAVSGSVVLVGAPQPLDIIGGSQGSGAAYVFRFDGASWNQEAKLTASDGATWDQFGFSVSLVGNLAAISAPGDEPSGSGVRGGGQGAAYVFSFGGVSWSEEAKLVASDAAASQTFGHDVSTDGVRVLVGAPGDDGAALDAGAAYVFTSLGPTWSEEAKLVDSGAAPGDSLGFAVALSGDGAAVSAPFDDGAAADAGAVVVFRDVGGWAQEAVVIPGAAAPGDMFGSDISLEGDTLLSGAFAATGGAGMAWVFSGNAGVWSENLALAIAGSSMLGNSADLGGGRAVVGGPLSDGAGVLLSGAAWVFVILPPVDCNNNGVADDLDISSGTSQDCNGNGIPDECDISSGVSLDCNANGVPDECEADCNNNGFPDGCDIAAGTSLDCNLNSIPDECEADCNGNGVPDECDISAGTSQDCNGNGVPDECEITAGTSLDCNLNGIPDECEVDCNGNGVPDDCDLTAGTSQDCNGNALPDECDISAGISLDLNVNGIPDECEPDCNNNGVPDDLDISMGTSQDCNGNGVPDECDIAAGASLDCNTNGVPDECEADCNNNGVPDDCDIATGTSLDQNGNGIPDECEGDCNNNGVPDDLDISMGTSQDCNGNGVPDECDIAAGRSQDCNLNGIPDECEADCNGNGVPDECDIAAGTSSDLNGNGIPDECEADCNSNGVPDDVDISLGTSQDCNGNGVPDECDIAAGTSFDLNGNGIPDECEADCNNNGVPDDLDISTGTSQDCNGNGVPDECDIASGTSADTDGNGTPDECQGLWTDLGNGLTGSAGVPLLTGTGTLLGGDQAALTLSNALPGAASHFVLGFSAIFAPLKGGVLVPAPDMLISGIPVDALGQVVLATSWPTGLPAGVVTYYQFWVTDPAGPVGFAASNGVSATTP